MASSGWQVLDGVFWTRVSDRDSEISTKSGFADKRYTKRDW